MQYLDRKYFSLAGEMKVKSEFKYTIAFIEQRIYYSQLSYHTFLILRSSEHVQYNGKIWKHMPVPVF